MRVQLRDFRAVDGEHDDTRAGLDRRPMTSRDHAGVRGGEPRGTLGSMDRDTFTARFHTASAAARDYAQEFVHEPLPEPLRYRLRLNSSYDENPRVGDEVVYPEDSAFARAAGLHDVGADEVLAELWRGGRVPEWINLTVIGERGASTLIEVRACGRFSGLASQLYHAEEGDSPFHVVSPTLPSGYRQGERFSVYDRSECWTRAELEQVARHADRVWMLQLYGDAFGDEGLAALPEFPRLEVLEVRHAPLTGPGLAGLARAPALRVLRVHPADTQRLELAALPSLAALANLELELPARVTGAARLVALERLTELSLRAWEAFTCSEALPMLPRLRRFSLRAPTLASEMTPRAMELEVLAVHVAAASDAEVLRMMDGHGRLETLRLRGTPVTDALLGELKRWPRLRSLEVEDTRISEAALRKLARRRRELKIWPQPR